MIVSFEERNSEEDNKKCYRQTHTISSATSFNDSSIFRGTSVQPRTIWQGRTVLGLFEKYLIPACAGQRLEPKRQLQEQLPWTLCRGRTEKTSYVLFFAFLGQPYY